MDPTCLVLTVQAAGGVILNGNVFMLHFQPVNSNQSSFERHSIVADHVHPNYIFKLLLPV